MMRIAAADGGVALDPRGRLGGRGAYLHRRRECVDSLVKSKVREFRSLKRGIDREARAQLAMAMNRLAISGTRD